MKKISLFFIGLLITGMSFSQTTAIDQKIVNKKVEAHNLHQTKSVSTRYNDGIETSSYSDYFTNYNAFITKLTNLTNSADSSAQLNTFWNDLIATGNFPFAIETKVAFLYRGTASSISWAGMLNNWDMNADAGNRLGVSDIWILEKELPKDTRCEYKIVKNGSEWLADPNNPHPLVGDFGNSELWMPDYKKHTELVAQSGISEGTLSANILKSSSKLGYSCQYRVYTPAGYSNLSNLPTIYVTDGQNYLDNKMGKMITVLDNLIADGTIQPVIAIFLDPRDPNNLSNDRRGNEYRNNINFANYVTQELIPDIDATYKTNASPDARTIMGASYGGYNAAYFSVAATDYFHNFGINSAYLHPNGSYDIDSRLQAANLDNLKFYLSYGTFDADGERYYSRLKNIFDAKGKTFNYTIVGDGHTWQNWSRVIGDALEYFIPKSETKHLSLTYPNGGEFFIPDSLVTILWTSDFVDNIKIEYSINNGIDWNEIVASVSATTGKYNWTTPNTTSGQYKIKISDVANAAVNDESDHVFEIGNDISGYPLQMIVDNSINYYRTLKQNNQIPDYELVVVPEAGWAGHSAKVHWDFEPGYVEGNKLYITKPHTTAQLEVFPDMKSVVRYTVAKEMLLKYLATNAPEWFQYGYAAYEAQLDRPYETIRAIYAANGNFPDLPEFDTFDPENNIQQRDLAFTMGEYCMLILGDYPKFPSFNSNGITVLTGNQTKANGFWHLFLEKHYLESEDQVKILVKNKKIAIYGASKESQNAQMYLDTLTSLLYFYEDAFQMAATRRIHILINPDRCTQLLVEGYECTTNEGGGGHGSGLAGCSFVPQSDNINIFISLMVHEFTHVYQFWLKSNFMPAWLSEGFASCMPGIKAGDFFVNLKEDMFNKWTVVRQNLGRDPTISELMDYGFVRNNNIDYYGIGLLMVDYIVKKNGYLALQNIIESNGRDFSSMGFGSKEDFMDYFYHYFNIRIMEEKVVTLTAPLTNVDYTTSTIDFKWTALNQNIPMNVKISTNAGDDWSELLTNTKRSDYSWNVPHGFYGDFYLKFSAPENLNISNIYGPFQRINVDILNLLSPVEGGFFIAGDTINIKWGNTKISNIKIEYSIDNGTIWTEIVSGTPTASGSYNWTIPNETSNQCLIKISDASNPSVFDISDENFEIGPANNAGGPYAVDDNTVLLLHFENSLSNSSPLSEDGIYHGNSIAYSNSPTSILGHCLKINGSSYISVPHNTNLNLTGDWTIELWFKPVSYNNGLQYLLYKPGDDDEYLSNYSLQMNGYWNNELFCFYFSSDQRIGINNGLIPELNQWYHLAFIRDTKNSQIKLIIHNSDRKQISSKTTTDNGNNPLTNIQDLIIGLNLDAYIDEVRISNVVRTFENTTGISENAYGSLISIYPNPADHNVFISAPEIVDLAIFSLTGQKVIERKDFLNGNIDVSTFKKGVYVIQFSGKKGIESRKLIIE